MCAKGHRLLPSVGDDQGPLADVQRSREPRQPGAARPPQPPPPGASALAAPAAARPDRPRAPAPATQASPAPRSTIRMMTKIVRRMPRDSWWSRLLSTDIPPAPPRYSQRPRGLPLLTYQDRDLDLSLHHPIGANHLAGEDIELHELAAFRGQAEGNELQQDVRILPVILKQLDRLLQRGHRTRPRFLLDELDETVIQGASRGNLLACRAHHQHGRTARVVPGDLDLDHARRYRLLLKRPQGQAHTQPLAGRQFTAFYCSVGNCRRLTFACQTDLDVHVQRVDGGQIIVKEKIQSIRQVQQ